MASQASLYRLNMRSAQIMIDSANLATRHGRDATALECIRSAIRMVCNALSAANRDGAEHAKRSAFRVLNWLRAILRRA